MIKKIAIGAVLFLFFLVFILGNKDLGRITYSPEINNHIGKALIVIILAGISGASFLIWKATNKKTDDK